MSVGLAPTFTLILISLGFASAAGSFWHPIALGLLSQRFPERRGFVICLHRAGGSVGSTIAPTLVGVLLLVIS
jgi:FSR family fosmidomycin resistance protein-like MFS transporter